MRGPRTALALIAVVATTAVSASILRAQQAADVPASADRSGGDPDSPSTAPRTARQLLRNGLDYLDTYKDPERALTFLRAAEAKQKELPESDRRRLSQGIERARRGLREPSTMGGARVARRSSPLRPGAIALAPPPKVEGDAVLKASAEVAETPEPAPLDLPAARPEPAEVKVKVEAPKPAEAAAPPILLTPEETPGEPALPPSLGPALPRAGAPPRTEAEPIGQARPAEPPAEPPALAPAETPVPVPAEPPALAPAAPLSQPATEPGAAPAVKPLAPPPAESLAPPPAEALAPPPAEALAPPPAEAPVPEPSRLPVEPPASTGDVETPPLPELPPTAATAPREVVAPPIRPASRRQVDSPAPATTAGADRIPPIRPAGSARMTRSEAAPMPTPAPEPAPDPVPVEPPALLDPPAARASALSAQEIEAPAPTQAPAPVPAPEPVAPAPAPEASSLVPPSAPPRRERLSDPAPADDLPPLPAGGATSGAPPTAPAPGRLHLPDEGLGPSPTSGSAPTIRPESLREVDEIARRQEDAARQNPPPNPLTTGSSMGNDSPMASRLELPRAPSPTEPRPIRVIPPPEEYVPLPARDWSPNRKYWVAGATCHMPLYFQDAVLERYGQGVEQSLGPVGRFFSYPLDDPRQSNQRNQLLQPGYSAGLFITQIIALPYNLIVDPPWEAEYDLGYYRPGDRTPPDLMYLPTTGVGPVLKGNRYGRRAR